MSNSSLLVVGSLAYDQIESPYGSVERTLGGSGNYFSLAASLFTPPRVVGVVGDDYDPKDWDLLAKREVDLSGVQKVPGKTFFWSGSYVKNLNEAETKETQLNVFAQFNPTIPAKFADSKFVFLANIDPNLQLKVLENVQCPILTGLDTMNLWIHSQRAALEKVIPKVNVVMMNELEAKLLTGIDNAVGSAAKISEMGPKIVVIKRGEFGFLCYQKGDGYFSLPVLPVKKVMDPTGAGDSFAGGFWGYLAKLGKEPDFQDVRRACVVGNLVASFTIREFGTIALQNLKLQDLSAAYQDFQKVIQFPALNF